MQTAYGALTDTGLKRSHNEDSLIADAQLGLYLVCDGMGGRNAGEVASQLAVEVVHGHMREARLNAAVPLVGHDDPLFSAHTNRLASAIRLAHQAIHDAAARDTSRNGMGSTVVAALLTGEILSIAHVGDSRLYLVRERELQPLTADHSLVAEQVRHGLLTQEEADRSPQRNIVTRALGVDDHVRVEMDEIHVRPGDSLLLCSDGLTRGVKPDAILRTLTETPDPQSAARRLIDLANAAGGEDNTTVIVVRVGRSGEAGGWWRRWIGMGLTRR